jgi:hypothetical protein
MPRVATARDRCVSAQLIRDRRIRAQVTLTLSADSWFADQRAVVLGVLVGVSMSHVDIVIRQSAASSSSDRQTPSVIRPPSCGIKRLRPRASQHKLWAMPSSHAGRLSRTAGLAAACAGVAAWCSLGVLAVTDGDGARRVGILPPLWLLAALIAVVIALAAATRLSARASRPLFLSAFVLLPWIPLPVPQVFLVWTGPAVRFVWAAIALAMSADPRVRRGWRDSPLSAANNAPLVAGAIAFAILAGVHAGQGNLPNGDEPHYLVIAQSLLADHDVKVANNYERGDYQQYYGGWLQPHLSAWAGNGGAYSAHAPGLGAIVAPAFAAGGYRGAATTVALLTAFGTSLVWLAAFALTSDAAAAWFAWAVATLTVPGVLLGSLVYPDAIAGVILAAGLLALVRIERAPDREWPLWPWIALGTMVGALPWLHTRLTLPAAVLAALLAARVLERRHAGWVRQLAALCVPLAVSVGGWLMFFRVAYGTFNPSAPYGGGVPLELGQVVSGLRGLLLDQEFGLLPNAPVHVIVLAGVWFLVRARARLAIEALLLIVPYAVAASAYPLWWAGSSSPARFLTPVIFPSSIVAAMGWSGLGPGGKRVALTLLGVSALITAACAFGGEGVLAYNDAAGRARLLDWVSPLVDLPGAFPDAFRTGVLAPAAVWIAALSCWAALVVRTRGARSDAPGGAFMVPATFLIACMIAIAASWQIAGPAGRVTATRAQLDLLRGFDPRLLPLGVQLFPPRRFAAADIPRRLAIGTSPLGVSSPPTTLLHLTEVPAGRYYVRVTARANAGGEITLGIGAASAHAARWRLTGPAGVFPVTLPIVASILDVRADEDAVRSIEQVALTPAADVRVAPIPGRARDAARYGSTVVYATDNRVLLEADGFWVLGERQPDVVITTDAARSAVTLEIRNGQVANRVRLRTGRWSSEHAFAPGELWSASVPTADHNAATVVNIFVERGFRPAQFDAASTDHRLLGCRIVIR